MGKRIGMYLQTAGGCGLLLAAGAGDTGAFTAGQLALALACCAALFAVGLWLRRRAVQTQLQ